MLYNNRLVTRRSADAHVYPRRKMDIDHQTFSPVGASARNHSQSAGDPRYYVTSDVTDLIIIKINK